MLSKEDDNDDMTAEEMESLDIDLAREIEEALSLAQDALTVEAEALPEEEDIDEIANMLLESPPISSPPLPVPPQEEPPASVISLSLEEDVDEEDDVQPPPPESPPAPPVNFFAEALQKKVAEEIEKLKNLIPGLQGEIVEVEASTEKEEETAAVLKKEIEESIQEREAMVKRIEQEFAWVIPPQWHLFYDWFSDVSLNT